MTRADRVKGNLTFDYPRPPNRRISVTSQLLEANNARRPRETFSIAHTGNATGLVSGRSPLGDRPWPTLPFETT